MAFTYVVYYFTIEPNIPWSEILIAQLQSLPFESFEITDSGFNAYVNESKHYNNFLTNQNNFGRQPRVAIVIWVLQPWTGIHSGVT